MKYITGQLREATLRRRQPSTQAVHGGLSRSIALGAWRLREHSNIKHHSSMYSTTVVKRNGVLLVFFACGGIRTGSRMPVLTVYFPVLA